MSARHPYFTLPTLPENTDDVAGYLNAELRRLLTEQVQLCGKELSPRLDPAERQRLHTKVKRTEALRKAMAATLRSFRAQCLQGPAQPPRQEAYRPTGYQGRGETWGT